MTRFLTAAAILALGFGVAQSVQAQPAPQSTPEPRSCFYPRDINSFNVPNDQTVYLRVGVNNIYRLDLAPGCINLTFHQRLGFKTQPAGSSICSPLDVEVIDRETGGPQTCTATGLHRLTPAEVATLPNKYKP